MPDDLHPHSPGLYLNQFENAYELHQAAGAVRLFFNRTAVRANFQLDDKAKSRQAILTIAEKLILIERDAALDEFCRAWLRYRELPIPEKHYGPSSSVGVQGAEGTDGRLRESGGLDEGAPNTLHNAGSPSSPQPPGGQSLP